MNVIDKELTRVPNIKKEIIKCYENNPVLKPADMPADCCAVYNSGVVKTSGGEYIMASRFADSDMNHYLWISRSRDGTGFKPDDKPVEFVCKPEEQEEYDRNVMVKDFRFGSWYDPCICPVDNTYYITYCVEGDALLPDADSSSAATLASEKLKYHVASIECRRIAVGKTEDFKKIHHVSFPLHSVNRQGLLFPEKINGEYYMLYRPESNVRMDIWIASSPDLEYWGNNRVIAIPRYCFTQKNIYTHVVTGENEKISLGAPPIRTDEGWLVLYHAVFPLFHGGIYYGAGALLLDIDRPWIVKAHSSKRIVFGQDTGIVFIGALIPENDGRVKIYYGGADYTQCLATARLDDLIDACYDR